MMPLSDSLSDNLGADSQSPLWSPPAEAMAAPPVSAPPPVNMNLLQLILQWLQATGGKNLTGRGRSFTDYTPSDR